MKAQIHRGNTATEYFFREGCWITEWWNTADDEAASIVRVRLEPGRTTRDHFLHATTERYVLLEGRGRVHVGDLPPTEVGPGDIVHIPPETMQHITNIGEGDLLFLAVCTPRFAVENYREG